MRKTILSFEALNAAISQRLVSKGFLEAGRRPSPVIVAAQDGIANWSVKPCWPLGLHPHKFAVAQVIVEMGNEFDLRS